MKIYTDVGGVESGGVVVPEVYCEMAMSWWAKLFPNFMYSYRMGWRRDTDLLDKLVQYKIIVNCGTKEQLKKVINSCPPPDRPPIILAGSALTKPALAYASRKGINSVTFDSDASLQKIIRLLPTAQVTLQLRTEDGPLVPGLEPTEIYEILRNIKQSSTTFAGLKIDTLPGSHTLQALIEKYNLFIRIAGSIFTIASAMEVKPSGKQYVFDLGGSGLQGFGTAELEIFSRAVTAAIGRNFIADSTKFMIQLPFMRHFEEDFVDCL